VSGSTQRRRPGFVEVTSPGRGSLPRAADRPRLLARQDGKRHPQQYTASTAAALHAEPEAIDETTQRRFSDEARRTYEVLKAEELARKASRSRCGRLKKVDQDARKRGVDIHRHLAAIEREIGLAEQLVHPAT
jgi:hypothetical protein